MRPEFPPVRAAWTYHGNQLDSNRQRLYAVESEPSGTVKGGTRMGRPLVLIDFDGVLTLPWLKPRDSCELGLLALGR